MTHADPAADAATVTRGEPATWAEFLDTLERDARHTAVPSPSTTTATTMPPADGAAWVPPSGLGPMPAGLADRARAVLAAQQDAAAALRGSMSAARRHRAAIAAVPSADAGHPVYLDVTG
ncbi:hypothetical protein [Occultella gossypii]|uniref:Uncharacterized protein n=1 Tax=Occultella gossypii TaxID=2800820 RepID=A0ABS7S925_9MICO|nr:hypothetical protein [Occultella gossypii]MBZ2196851.1 hypothetical protein [Occultella gossypii]